MQTLRPSHVSRKHLIDKLNGGLQAEKVFDQQSEEVQVFLLQTTILDRLTRSLCDAITWREDSQAVARAQTSGLLSFQA